MDIISHGLWSSISFGRKNRKSFWLSFIFGIMPDFLAFAPYTVLTILGLTQREWKFGEPPDPTSIPSYVYSTYNFSHSLVIFSIIFILLWIIFRRPIWEFSGWGLHILFDIPLHTTKFFPTPFLWPVSDLHINGHPWADPIIFIPNVVILATLYCWYFWIRPKKLNKIDFNKI